MHSKALVETHLFSYIAKSLDILHLNHEITGNAGSEWKCTEGGEGFGMIMYKGGGTFWKCTKLMLYIIYNPSLVYIMSRGLILALSGPDSLKDCV